MYRDNGGIKGQKKGEMLMGECSSCHRFFFRSTCGDADQPDRRVVRPLKPYID